MSICIIRHYISLFAILLLANHNISAQVDTIRFMQYNLLYYGNNSNPTTYKDPRLKTIVEYIQPDIISTNEISDNAAL